MKVMVCSFFLVFLRNLADRQKVMDSRKKFVLYYEQLIRFSGWSLKIQVLHPFEV